MKIKNFDEMRENFIEDLTNQFSDLLVPGAQGRDRNLSVRLKPNSNMLVTGPEDGGADKPDQEMAEEDQEEERKDSDSEGSAGALDDDSDEENSNMIPDEKPDGAAAIGDTTANENDLLA